MNETFPQWPDISSSFPSCIQRCWRSGGFATGNSSSALDEFPSAELNSQENSGTLDVVQDVSWSNGFVIVNRHVCHERCFVNLRQPSCMSQKAFCHFMSSLMHIMESVLFPSCNYPVPPWRLSSYVRSHVATTVCGKPNHLNYVMLRLLWCVVTASVKSGQVN